MTSPYIMGLLTALKRHHPETDAHSEQVTELAVRLATYARMKTCQVEEIRLAARVHDIGKLIVPIEVLTAERALAGAEWAQMQAHVVYGTMLLAGFPGLERVAAAVRCHHERWDGAGYPYRVAGTDIPVAARVIAVCDAYDAMVTDRPYRRAMAPHEAIAELRRCAGTQFDPAVVDALLAVTA